MPAPAAEPFHAFAGSSGNGLVHRPFQRMGAVKSVAGALITTGALVPPALAARAVSRQTAARMPRLWHQWMTRSLGVTTGVEGELASGSVLYVCNHLSWLDIPVLGSRITGSFVAKAEVGEMGFVTFLADFQRTIYVERQSRVGARAQASDIETRLAAGDNVILFPEGTSNDGVRILPFKSALFSVVEGDGGNRVRIQPITLAYTHLNGLPLTRNRLMDIAWIGDMALGSHALAFMRLGRIKARILFHPPVRREDFRDRKALARHCQAVVTGGYRRLMRGRG